MHSAAEDMFFQLILPVVLLAASIDWTFEGPVLWEMSQGVICSVADGRKSAVTPWVFASVGLFLGVLSHVDLHVGLVKGCVVAGFSSL